MGPEFQAGLDRFVALGSCFVLSVLYVSSLYVWRSQHNRDHPSTIKKRFLSVFIMMFVSPLVLYISIDKSVLKKVSIWSLMGLRADGLTQAFFMPLFLTMILFLGPIAMQGFSGLLKMYFEPMYWWSNVTTLIWLRSHVVAPLSEEFTFRSCMLPLLLQHFSPLTAVFVCPLFFGVAHFHHIIERMRTGYDFKTSFLIGCFHFAYTTIFGAYSAYLLLRTGHFAATVVAHAFCNHMGMPDFNELATFKGRQRSALLALFVAGLALWCCLLNPLTEPRWYRNDTSWLPQHPESPSQFVPANGVE